MVSPQNPLKSKDGMAPLAQRIEKALEEYQTRRISTEIIEEIKCLGISEEKFMKHINEPIGKILRFLVFLLYKKRNEHLCIFSVYFVCS